MHRVDVAARAAPAHDTPRWRMRRCAWHARLRTLYFTLYSVTWEWPDLAQRARSAWSGEHLAYMSIPNTMPQSHMPGHSPTSGQFPNRTSHMHRDQQRTTPAARGPAITPRLVFVFAVATGMVVANLYYAQPLLAAIARQFHASAAQVGLIVTLTQAGYALGLLLVVPLGDLLDRRRLIVTVLVATAISLAVAALAPSLVVLVVAALAIGLTSCVAQVMVPFAASLATDAQRGRVVGRVMSGLLIGVLLARTVSGLISQVTSWRIVYGAAALFMLALIAVLWHELPRARVTASLSYGRLLRSVATIAAEEPVLRRRAAYGALTFAAFSVLWTSIAFLLSRPPYGFGEAVIGLFGLVGVAGATAASFAGSLADRGLARIATGAFLLLTLLSFALIAIGAHSLLALIAGIVLLDLGAQGTQVTNQSEIYRLRPEARSRITTAYMVCYFIGGAVGSAAAATLYSLAGWMAVALLGAGFMLAAMALWLTELRPRQAGA